MSEEEFAGFAFAVGVVRGSRSFKVDALGRLTGVSFEKVWRPGENTAKCFRDEDRRYLYNQYIQLASYSYHTDTRSWMDKVLGAPAPGTVVADVPAPPPHSMEWWVVNV